jgi:hypothetical protein
MRNVTPSKLPRLLVGVAVALLILALCLLFPRVLAFTELAARELRYLWWLVLLAALGAYFLFFFGRKKD